jgi:hypothetical protein
MKPNKDTIDASARSPFAGCVILIAAVCVMVFLVGFSIVALFRQFSEIAKFTAEEPVGIEVSAMENKEPELNALAERLESFRQQLSGDDEASLALTADDMNLVIAAYEPFKDLRGTFRIESVADGVLRIAISFSLNGKPRLAREGEGGLIASDSRFLNATMVAKPALLKHEVILKLDDIEVPGVVVPREFIEQMSPYRITERYLTDSVLGPAMAKLTRVEIEDGKMKLTRVPGEIPADVIGNEQVDAASNRFFVVLGIAACVFLMFAGVIVFLGLRAKNRRS